MTDYIHIVSLIAPSPPDYGGAFDLFYKIPELARLGKKVILHYFDYKEGRGHAGLEPYCVAIYKYERTAFWRSLVTLKPYIVSSRIQTKLIDRLNFDHHPVLLEGIHSTGVIPYLNNRKILVRVHNNEADYYHRLKVNEDKIIKSAYFLYEAALLSFYQKRMPKQPTFLFVSETDKETFKSKYQQPHQFFLPCFVPWQQVQSLEGKGKYCLYHGNLCISENIKAALWLAQSIFSEVEFTFVIAGKGANNLKSRLPEHANILFVNDPTDEQLSDLIQNAQINVLPSFNSTGVKLKLIHALFEGRFSLTNHAGLSGSGLEGFVPTPESSLDWIMAIRTKMTTEFTKEMIEERIEQLRIYNNAINAEKLSALL
jgi:hypothetical protein